MQVPEGLCEGIGVHGRLTSSYYSTALLPDGITPVQRRGGRCSSGWGKKSVNDDMSYVHSLGMKFLGQALGEGSQSEFATAEFRVASNAVEGSGAAGEENGPLSPFDHAGEHLLGAVEGADGGDGEGLVEGVDAEVLEGGGVAW